jgi:hypothetical protein
MPPTRASAVAGAGFGGPMLVPQKPVHAGPCDAEAACYFGATGALGRQLAHQASVDGRPAALVDTADLSCGYPSSWRSLRRLVSNWASSRGTPCPSAVCTAEFR